MIRNNNSISIYSLHSSDYAIHIIFINTNAPDGRRPGRAYTYAWGLELAHNGRRPTTFWRASARQNVAERSERMRA